MEQGADTGLVDVAAGDADDRVAGQADGDHTGAGVFQADDAVALGEGNAQADAGGFGIEPGVGFGGQFAECATLAGGQAGTGGDDGVVEIAGVAQIHLLEGGVDFRPGFAVEAGGDQADFDAVGFKAQEELFEAGGGLEGFEAAATLGDEGHFTVSDLVVELAGLFEAGGGAVLGDAVLQVLGDGVAGDVRQILGGESEVGVVHQFGDGLLNDPDPELFAVDGGAVQVHQHRQGGRLEGGIQEGVEGGGAEGGVDQDQGFVSKDDELGAAVAWGEDALDAVVTDAPAPVGGGGQIQEVVLVAGVDEAQAGESRLVTLGGHEEEGSVELGEKLGSDGGGAER